MKLVWHIFLKDLRRLGFLLVLWGAVIVMQYLAWLSRSPQDHGNSTANAVVWLWALHLIAGWLLVPRLIQEDSPTDERAAWRTLPISGGRLLIAKVLGLAVMFWLWPSVLTLPWWIGFGFGPGEIVRVLAVNMLGMACLTSLAVLVAVLTSDFARYVAWSIVLVLATGLIALVVVTGFGRSGDFSLLITRISLVNAVLAAAVLVIVPFQFLGRRVLTARLMAAGAALVIGVIVVAWPWTSTTMRVALGLERNPIPATTVRVQQTALMLPPDPALEKLGLHVTAQIAMKGLAETDVPAWLSADPEWRIGGHWWPGLNPTVDRYPEFHRAAEAVARGSKIVGDTVEESRWRAELSGKLLPGLKSGAALLRAQPTGALWRGELGPSVALQAGAGGARGLRQLHVAEVGLRVPDGYVYRGGENGVAWLQTEPLFAPSALIEMVRFEKIQQRSVALFTNPTGSLLEDSPEADRTFETGLLPRPAVPVGLIGVSSLSAAFRQLERMNVYSGKVVDEDFLKNGASLTIVGFRETWLEVALPETPFVPELVVESKLEDALRRAKTEGKGVFARINRGTLRAIEPAPWRDPRVHELLRTKFVCAEISESDGAILKKPGGSDVSSSLFVLTADGVVRDRLWDLWNADDLLTALRANLAGKTYVDALREQLAAPGGDDRQLRFRLVDALRAGGELAGVLDNMLWLLDHPNIPFERAEVMAVGRRLERLVVAFGPAKDALLERRARALADLRKNPQDPDAARLVFEITLGLRHDDKAWQQFPGIFPRENPSWWDFMVNWIVLTVSEKRYREVVDAVDLEKFFNEGLVWVQSHRVRQTGGMLYVGFKDWREQLTWTGAQCVEALAGAGQNERALRLAETVVRTSDTGWTRNTLASALHRAGANAEADQLLKPKPAGD